MIIDFMNEKNVFIEFMISFQILKGNPFIRVAVILYNAQ